jgi:hypothetical protein
VAWQVTADPGTTGSLTIGVMASFAGNRHLDATAEIAVNCALPTATATIMPTNTPTASQTPRASNTPPPSPTPTATEISPTPTATPPGGSETPTPAATPGDFGKVCDFISGRVPSADINRALAEPGRVSGWGTLCYRNRPAGPFNHVREYLSIRRISVPYHRTFNPLIYKCGCP